MDKALGKPKRFTFESYRLDHKTNTVFFEYSFDNGWRFTESLSWGKGKIDWKKNRPLINQLLFNLHLVLGIGYYKAFCPRQIIIKSGSLNQAQAAFWDKLYTKGLGEFFYKNKIDYRGLVRFPFRRKNSAPTRQIKLRDRCLCSWGGGKDSCVAAERLRELGHDFSLISLNNSAIQKETAAIIKARRFVVKRTMDPSLKELNQRGAYNGHVPITAVFSWVALITAILKDYRRVVFANEASASFGNINYLGQEINHQYAKSLEFENDLRRYLHDFLSPNLEYFSLLRHLPELEIVRLFAHYPKYFPAFSSCNRNFSQSRPLEGRWCNECPKCTFIFAQLAAFLSKKQVLGIFGENLFQKKSLLPIFQELSGEKRFKPFECVGTPEEMRAALFLALGNKDWSHDFIPSYFRKGMAKKISSPRTLIEKALEKHVSHNIPLGFRPTLILGYGQEGHFAHRYVRKLSPRFPLGIADQKKPLTNDRLVSLYHGPRYLSSLSSYELVIKSPGISGQQAEILAAEKLGCEITTITNLFLEKYAEQTIGVTGTKGKSTTATLIYKIFQAAGRNLELVGNIGHDPLQHLDSQADTKKIFVYEMSSYQLATAKQSPHVAVFINIFPDHLPYHGGFKNYWLAKANIGRWQSATDYLVFNHDYPAIKALAAKSPAQKIDYLKKGHIKNGDLYYSSQRIIRLSEIKLLGRHNLENIMAAICVAKIFRIPNPAICRALASFKNLEHRLELVGKYHGIIFYDDAISTTPESTLAAIEVFREKIGTIILGGEDRGYDFKKLASRIVALGIRNVVLFPDSGRRIGVALEKEAKKRKGFRLNLLPTKNMGEAVRFAYRHTGHGQICLLSCASPSYSLFRNFQEKGRLFQEAVKKYSVL